MALPPMTGLDVGQKVKVRYSEHTFKYTLDVEVTAIRPNNQFVGRVERVFAHGEGEITGGDICRLNGQEMTFENVDITARKRSAP